MSTSTSNVNVTVAPDGTVYVQNLGKNESDEENSDDDDILIDESETKKIKKETKIKGVNKKSKVKSVNDDDESNDS